MTQSAFSQAFEDGAAADVAAFSDGEGTYTTAAGVATTGIDYAIDYDADDELSDERGIEEANLATVHIPTTAVAATAIGDTFTTADSVLWAIEMVQTQAGIATLTLVRTTPAERSAVGGHRMERET